MSNLQNEELMESLYEEELEALCFDDDMADVDWNERIRLAEYYAEKRFREMS